MQNYSHVLIHYGEIALKGKNRNVFIRQLRENISQKMKAHGIEEKVIVEHGLFFIPLAPQQEKRTKTLLQILSETPGVVWFAPCVQIPAGGIDALQKNVFLYMKKIERPFQTFRIQVKRVDKSFSQTSPEIERMIGRYILRNISGLRVQLSQPEMTIFIEIHTNYYCIFHDKKEGIGGLPVGSSGKVMMLLSGGIDSPVASYLLAKRGCQVIFLHFTVNQMQVQDAKHYKVFRIAHSLMRFLGSSQLYLAPYIHFQSRILDKSSRLELVLFRRFMAKIAERLCDEVKASALASGDNLAQVASQTLSNLVITSHAVRLPILRPLLTYDKVEIVALAKKIGTYDLSLEPYRDCCSLIDRHPKTTSKIEAVQRMEKQFFPDYEEMIQQTLEDTTVISLP